MTSILIVHPDRKNAVNEAGAGAGNVSPSTRTEISALIDVRYPPSERGPVSAYNVFVERT